MLIRRKGKGNDHFLVERVVRLGRVSLVSVISALIFVAASRLLNSASPNSSFFDAAAVLVLEIFFSVLLGGTDSGSASISTDLIFRVVLE